MRWRGWWKAKKLVRVRNSYRLPMKKRAASPKKSPKKEARVEGEKVKKPRKKEDAKPKAKKSPRKGKEDATEKEKLKKRGKKTAEDQTAEKVEKKKTKDKTERAKKVAVKRSDSKTAKKGRKQETDATNNNNDSDAPAPVASGGKYNHTWQYEDNGWKNYDAKGSDLIEEVYVKYLANRGDNDVRAVKSGQWEYQVDFMAFKQTNIQHPNHTVRNIRRINAKGEIDTKGV